jgi:hypothetical protein
MSDDKKADWLDYAKAICIFFMIFNHSTIWSTSVEDYTLKDNPLANIIVSYSFFGWFSLMIPTLSGCSFYRTVNGLAKKDIFIISSILILSGFLLNIIVWGFRYAFEWDALQTIGISYLIIYFFHKSLSDIWLFFVSIIFLVITRNTFAWPENYLTTVLFGNDSGTSYWPIFPWFFTIVFGFIFMKVQNYKKPYFNFVVFLFSLLFITISYQTGNLFPQLAKNNVWGGALFQVMYLHIVGLVGVFGILFLFSLYCERAQTLAKLIRKISKNIFWIYVTHIMLGYSFSALFLNTFSWFKSATFFVFVLTTSILISFGVDKILSTRLYISLKKESE